jgi:hypothetical protein
MMGKLRLRKVKFSLRLKEKLGLDNSLKRTSATWSSPTPPPPLPS